MTARADKPLHLAYVAVGSNIDPETHVVSALNLLIHRVDVAAGSTFYRTEPLGPVDGRSFVNGVWQIRTPLPPRALKFHVLRGIEAELGRTRTHDRYASRTIDLDLILYDDRVIREPGLIVPDPDIRTRNFLAVPLLELDPELILPDTNEPLADIVTDADRAGLEPLDELTLTLREMLQS